MEKPVIYFKEGSTLSEEIAAVWIAAGKAGWNVFRTQAVINEALEGNYSCFLFVLRKHFTFGKR